MINELAFFALDIMYLNNVGQLWIAIAINLLSTSVNELFVYFWV